jgi:hypothetical protein
MADIEVNFPTNLKLINVIDDTWTARLTRRSNEKEYWIAEFRDLGPTEIYAKFGVEVPVKNKKPAHEGKATAESLLREHLTKLSGRTIVPTSEVQDLLLDVLNEIGGTDVDDS